jgi:hypothetical protein
MSNLDERKQRKAAYQLEQQQTANRKQALANAVCWF